MESIFVFPLLIFVGFGFGFGAFLPAFILVSFLFLLSIYQGLKTGTVRTGLFLLFIGTMSGAMIGLWVDVQYTCETWICLPSYKTTPFAWSGFLVSGIIAIILKLMKKTLSISFTRFFIISGLLLFLSGSFIIFQIFKEDQNKKDIKPEQQSVHWIGITDKSKESSSP